VRKVVQVGECAVFLLDEPDRARAGSLRRQSYREEIVALRLRGDGITGGVAQSGHGGS
jgi:hypothetical protein